MASNNNNSADKLAFVPEKISFPGTEEEILQLWRKLDAFQTSLKRSEGKPEFTFYDGPPFATGLPHYGHILAGTIKDIVTRYAHQTGHHVVRRFGWDCHGLPIEFEIDKQLGIKTRDEVLKMGIPKYNEACRGIVMKYSGDWERIVERLGRWIDFKNDYKTMDPTFMESVWWVFKQIFEKGLVYKAFKVMPYSIGCATPLSNFEANLNYKDVQDPTVVVKFPLVDDPKTAFVAWTTTPWTLPSNLALCVNPNHTYLKVQDKASKEVYILHEKRTVQVFKTPEDFTVLEKFQGKDLAGKKYVPMFNYFVKEVAAYPAFQVLADDFVTDDSGTGIVHCAPAFGEDDYRVCMNAGVIQKGKDIVCPVDANGRFTADVTDFAGVGVKEADKAIIKMLKDNGRLVNQSTLTHSYPFCWRSETPLIYKAVPSWFVAVESIRDRLTKNNNQTHWVPDFVKEKRFHNWLENARDWAISRNRFWGTPLPVWISEDGKETVVIGSIADLEKLSGKKITDLHRESIDDITIPDPRGGSHPPLKRVDEVFDCWFESGSMPYAQQHYPFENTKNFEHNFPADFIAEGIDQTRGWFYTLMVISTILFDKPPFKNVIVNGLVLAKDGKKMSKSKKNFTDPTLIVNDFGADALRLYLIDSPVVRAEDLKFNDDGVKEILKDVLLPWFNAYRFFTEVVHKYNKAHPTAHFVPSVEQALKTQNTLDKWVLSATSSLIKFVREEMKAYRLFTVVPRLVRFISDLTNWYVRLNRLRLKGSGGDSDTQCAMSTLFEVLMTLNKAMSPFTPFLTEYMYQNLKNLLPAAQREDSIHYLDFPSENSNAFDLEAEKVVKNMQSVISLARYAREKRTVPIKFPLTRVTVVHADAAVLKQVESMKSTILTELNIQELVLKTSEERFVSVAKPDNKALGKRLNKDFAKVGNAIKGLTQEQMKQLSSTGKIMIEGHSISSEEILIAREFKGDTAKEEPAWDEDFLILVNLEVDAKLQAEGYAREIVNRIQKARKKAGIRPIDLIEVFCNVTGKANLEALKLCSDFIEKAIGVPFSSVASKPATTSVIHVEKGEVNDGHFEIVLARLCYAVDAASLEKKLGSHPQKQALLEAIPNFVSVLDHAQLSETITKASGKYKVPIHDANVELELGRDLFASGAQWASRKH